jgi:pimeloyl-ACP methyl ester carboxylesterase
MRVRVNDELKLNYELSGDPASQPTVVLTHGMGGWLGSWADDIPSLAKRYAVLRWDVRGHGDSDKPDIPYSAEMHARDLAGLLRALDIKRAYVGGNSMGGAITQRFLLDFPELAAAGFLLCTSSQVGERLAGAWEERAVTAEEKGTEEALDRAESLANATAPIVPPSPEREAAARAATLKIPGRVYAHIVRAMAAYNWTAGLHRIRVPVLILQGLQDTMTPPGGSVLMHRAIPNSQLVMMDRCGHSITTDQPEQWRRHLLNFLDGVDHWDAPGG